MAKAKVKAKKQVKAAPAVKKPENNDIKSWLDSKDRDYDQGVAIYNRVGKNNNLKRFFLLKQSTHSINKLAYELQKIHNDNAPRIELKKKFVKKPVVKQDQKEEPEGSLSPVIITNDKKAASEYPEEVKSLISEKTNIFNQKGKLSNSLQTAGSDKERKEIVSQLDALDEQALAISAKIEAFEKTGKIPSGEKELPEDRAELAQELSNARSRRTKAEKKYKTLGNSPEGLKYKAKFDKEEKLIKEIEAKLK